LLWLAKKNKRSAFLDQIERDAEGTFVATARGWRSVQGD
jgi:hypothetical protein